MLDLPATLVCFAVKEEAAFFQPKLIPGGARVCVTGMGARNAAEGLKRALAEARPSRVITAGFAGGLDPDLAAGAVVFDADRALAMDAALRSAGAQMGRFVCVERVAVTAAAKAELRRTTGADAVEMESSVIREICREAGIPSATIRVISDAAAEDLPLDFNALMTADDRINYWRLAATIAGSPGKIPRLMRFQKQTAAAARALAGVLTEALGGRR